MKHMHVICLEGCHGVGKSTMLKNLSSKYPVLDEMFTDMPSFQFISPQSLPMEFIWVANWFQRLLKLYENDYKPIVFADRSPYSAIYYSKTTKETQEQLKNIMQNMQKELIAHGIIIHTVCITVQKEILFHRILKRLEREPFRLKYNEDSYDWMEKTWNFYDKFPWDFKIVNNEVQDDLGEFLECKLKEIGIMV